jgi:hypothetical protein
MFPMPTSSGYGHGGARHNTPTQRARCYAGSRRPPRYHAWRAQLRPEVDRSSVDELQEGRV